MTDAVRRCCPTNPNLVRSPLTTRRSRKEGSFTRDKDRLKQEQRWPDASRYGALIDLENGYPVVLAMPDEMAADWLVCYGSGFESPPVPRLTSDQRRVLGLCGGEGGIRTLDTVARMPHFECGAFDLSATSPRSVLSDGTEAPAGRRKSAVSGWFGACQALVGREAGDLSRSLLVSFPGGPIFKAWTS